MTLGRGERGNVLFYILIAVVLFAALSAVVSNMTRSNNAGGAGEEKAKLAAQAAIEYAQKAKLIVQDMKLSGVDSANLSFLQSGDAGYNDAPYTAKVFHPDGGGLPIPNLTDVVGAETLTPAAGVYMDRNAIDDVGTSAADVVVSIRGVTSSVCAKINDMLVGDPTIPSTGSNNHTAIFNTGATALTAGVCAGCAGKRALCVSQSSPTINTFYSVVDVN